MGTSQSSKGAPGGVPMVPSWVPAAGAAGGDDGAADGAAGSGDVGNDGGNPGLGDGGSNAPAPSSPTPAPQAPSPIAPAGRFSGARRNLGSFAKSGDSNSMRRGVGNYVRHGWGGADTTTRRMGGTTKNASALYGLLSGGPGGPGGVVETVPGGFDRTVLQGRSAREIIDAVVEAVRPVDGTLDAEASRRALNEAMTEVLARDENADLLNLSQEQRELAVEIYVASDVSRLFELDLAAHIQKNAPNATTAMARLKEIRAYIRETVAASFRKLKAAGQTLTGSRVTSVVRTALKNALVVFEGYAD